MLPLESVDFSRIFGKGDILATVYGIALLHRANRIGRTKALEFVPNRKGES